MKSAAASLTVALLVATACTFLTPDPEVDCGVFPDADCRNAVALALEELRPDEQAQRVWLDELQACAPEWTGTCPGGPFLRLEERAFGASVWIAVAERDDPVVVNVERLVDTYEVWWPVGSESRQDR